MLVLAVDTATSAVIAGLAQLSVAGEPDLLAERVTVTARAHGELLMPSVGEVMASAGVGMRDLDAVVCGAGPGPFTGLRIGMVTAAALGDGLGVPVYPVCSLDAIAYRAGAGSPLLVITDARRREVYWARYAAGRRTSGPAVDRPAALAETLGSHDTVVGSGAALYAEVFGSAADPAAPRHPDVAALIKPVLPVLRAEEPAPLLAPLYLRRPDAVPPGAPKSATPAGQAS